MVTRREICGFLCAALGVALTAKKLRGADVSKFGVDSLLAESGLTIPIPAGRSYRADAVITLLGLPVFSRKGVGSAFAALGETTEGGHKLAVLRLGGGANPEKTHGLRYDGSIEEVVLERGAAKSQAAYFGFVASSPNENFAKARQRMLSKSSPAGFYVAAEGRHMAGCARCEKGAISLPDQSRRDLGELIRQIRARFHDADRTTTELRTAGGATASTFLYSVLSAIRSGQPRSQHDYVHNAKEYRLELERAADPHNGVPIAASGLPRRPGSTTMFTGRTWDFATRQASTFHLWVNDQSDLPLRIEFQPRSYLRIVLEYEPSGAQPEHKRTEET